MDAGAYVGWCHAARRAAVKAVSQRAAPLSTMHGGYMVTSKWDTATGEVVIRCDAQTAHEVVKLLERESVKELVALREAVKHTIRTPGEGKQHA